MKVKDLIRNLSMVDPELDVVVRVSDGYCYDIAGKGEIGNCKDDVFVSEDEVEKINVVMLDIIT